MHEFMVQMYLFALKALEYILESKRIIINLLAPELFFKF